MDATVHLVRHGEVENPKGVIYGRMPGFHLSERGHRQAEAAAERLAEAKATAVWSSPLERAQQTAEVISRRLGVGVVTDERLTESDSLLEGIERTVRGLLKTWWSLRNPWRPSWGESFAEIRARMLAAITDAVAESPSNEVVIVSHQTPVIVARLSLVRSRKPPWIGVTPCHTGSVTSLVLKGDRLISASYFAPRLGGPG